MHLRRITYVPGSASIVEVPDGTRLLLDIAPGELRLRKISRIGRPGSTVWWHRFSFPFQEQTAAAKTAVDAALESIDGAVTVADVERRLERYATPRLEALSVEQEAIERGREAERPDAAPSRPFVSAHTRARWVVGLLGVTMLLDMIAVASGLAEYELLGRAMSGGVVTEAEAVANDARQALIGLVQVLLYIATVVLYCLWLYRAYQNLPALGARALRFSPGWAVGYFFIPILNRFCPYQAVKETWKASDPAVLDAAAWKQAGGSAVFSWWWAFWLITGWLGMLSFRLVLSAGENLERLRAATAVTLFADGTEVLAALFALLVVRSIDRRQEEKPRVVFQRRIVPERPRSYLPARGLMPVTPQTRRSSPF